MGLLIAPGKDAGELASALGLPKYTRAFTLRVRCGEVATIEAEFSAPADGTARLVEVFKRYRLEEAPLVCGPRTKERTAE